MAGTPRIAGILPALTTPFDARGAFSPGRLYDNIARYEGHGLSGYLVLGSTGEAVLLDGTERESAIRAAREAVPSDKALVVGVGAESTPAAIGGAIAAADAGADAVLLGTPHYYREAMTADALSAHFGAVADASPVPLLLYNVPKFTGLSLPLASITRAARHDRILGLKESSGDPAYLRAVLEAVPRDFAVLCGAVTRLAEALAAGAAGGILAAAVAIPEPLVAMAAAAEADTARAAELQRALTDGVAPLGAHGVAGFKAAVDLRGLHGTPPRPPLLAASEAVRSEIAAALDAMVASGLLGRREL